MGIVPISELQQLEIFNWKSHLVPFGKSQLDFCPGEAIEDSGSGKFSRDKRPKNTPFPEKMEIRIYIYAAPLYIRVVGCPVLFRKIRLVTVSPWHFVTDVSIWSKCKIVMHA